MNDIIHQLLTHEISVTFRKITINEIAASPPLTVVKNHDGETIVELCAKDGIIHVDYTCRYSNTRKKLRTKRPARRSAIFDPFRTPHFSRPRIKSTTYNIASPTFLAEFMRDVANHIRKNQPKGTRTPYSQKAKDRHAW